MVAVGEMHPETTKHVAVLARSSKHGGYCIAGKEIVGGQPVEWIRPVSRRQHEEVSVDEATMSDRRQAQLLDVVTMGLSMPAPRTYQQENWRLGSDRWTRRTNIGWVDLPMFVDADDDLWLDDSSPTDRLPSHVADKETSSLRLIEVDGVRYVRGSWDGRIKWRAVFNHLEVAYNLSLKDTAAVAELNRLGEDRFEAGASFLTISLGENFNGACYKLVAGVFDQELMGMS